MLALTLRCRNGLRNALKMHRAVTLLRVRVPPAVSKLLSNQSKFLRNPRRNHTQHLLIDAEENNEHCP